MKCLDVLWSVATIILTFFDSFSVVVGSKRHHLFDPLPNCLVLYSECFHSTSCRLLLDKVDYYCGSSLNECQTSSLSDCIHNIRQLRSRLECLHGCTCDTRNGYVQECQQIYSKVWSHPCEATFYNMINHVENSTRPSNIIKRTTRSPTADRIQQYKHQLIGDLGPVKPITAGSTSCYTALYDVCLKHISCRELWKIFRESCMVDGQNQCRMTSRDHCWQSFEGISWTGLGNCTCNDRNSDCHWIRLQTNYNKCIYEISRSGYQPERSSSSSYLSYIQNYENFAATQEPMANQQDHGTMANGKVGQLVVPPETTLATTTTSTTTTSTTTTIATTTIPRPRPTPRPTQRRPYSTRRPPPTRPPIAHIASTSTTTTPRTFFRDHPYAHPYQYPSNHVRHHQAPYHATTTTTTTAMTPMTMPYYSNQILDNRVHDDRARYPQNGQHGRDSYGRGYTPERNEIRYEQTYYAQHPFTTATTTLSPRDAYYVENGYVRANVYSVPKSNAAPWRTTTTPSPVTTVLTRPPISTTAMTTTTSTTTTTTTNPMTTTTTPTATTTTTTSAPPPSTTTRFPNRPRKPVSSRNFQFSRQELKLKRSNDTKSTCQSAFKHCDYDETCKWHLSELQMKCKLDDNCVRDQCAAAIRRFSRYVSKVLVEPMMFCQCSFSDGECKHLQQWMYPRCLYALYRDKPPRSTCTHAVKMCHLDSYCQRKIESFLETCSVEGNKCSSTDPETCRTNLIAIRGTYLEQPCYCPPDNQECLKDQNLMLPNNPCVEEAMVDYSKNHAPLPEPVITHMSLTKIPKEERVDIRDFTLPIGMTTIASELSIPEEDIEIIEVTVERPPTSTTTTEAPTTTTTTTPVPTKERKDLSPKNDASPEKELEVGSDMMPEKELEKIKFNNTTSKAMPMKKVNDSSAEMTNTTERPRHTTRKFGPASESYMTQAPPPKGGCKARNIDGDWIHHYKNTLVRQYTDWSGKCSFWCECFENETMSCQDLGCLSDGGCKTEQTKLAFGERIYLENRGACMCQSEKFICDTPADMADLEPGLYITAGYSKEELKQIKNKVPKNLLERAGLVSPEKSIAKDITSRLQFALERVMPKEELCRIVLLEEYVDDGPIMLTQLQWYGLDPFTNTSEPKWHSDRMAKICAPYVRQLEQNFVLERTDRYQLVLSTIKQLKVIDLLDGLPLINAIPSVFSSYSSLCSIYVPCLLLYVNRMF